MYRDVERDRSATNIQELSTRTVTMSRDQQIEHGFGICVKGGKDSGKSNCYHQLFVKETNFFFDYEF